MLKRFWVTFAVSAALASALSAVAYAATRTTPYGLYDAAELGPIIDQAQAATVTSDAIELRSLLGASIQITHGNVIGTLVMQSSNDCTNFYVVQGGSFASISGVGGEVVEIGDLRSKCYRFVYTHSSGVGSLLVLPYVKGK